MATQWAFGKFSPKIPFLQMIIYRREPMASEMDHLFFLEEVMPSWVELKHVSTLWMFVALWP